MCESRATALEVDVQLETLSNRALPRCGETSVLHVVTSGRNSASNLG